MNSFSYLLVAAVLLVPGCAQPERAGSDAGPQVIVVYVGGAVNTPGMHKLSRPFTIEHAIRQAGGLEVFEQDQNGDVAVRRKGSSQMVRVRRKQYGSFELADGDGVTVPRH
jgi:protein involved in polysaccharide export with SLBB domain